MTKFSFLVNEFRTAYPQFAAALQFSDEYLTMFWNLATRYISNEDYGILCGQERYTALTLMTAHLAALSVKAANGENVGPVQSAAVGDVNVAYVVPPVKNMWQFFLLSTPYGIQLLALLEDQSVGGFYIGGLPEGSAFRKVYGVY